MKYLFYDYFYHDVVIKSLLCNFADVENSNSIQFVLNICDADVEDDNLSDFETQVKCVFRNVHRSYIDLYHNIVGDYYISSSEINDKDPILIEYKEEMENYISMERLCKLKCYSIFTNGGCVKIISENDVEIVNNSL